MKNDKKIISLFRNPFIIFLLLIAVGIGSFLVYEAGFSLEVNFNGAVIGYAKNEEIIESAVATVDNEVLEAFGEEAYFEKEILTERVRGHNKEIIEASKLSEKIADKIEIYKPASVIMIDDSETIVVESDEIANELLEKLKQPYQDLADGRKVLKVYFAQDVKVVTKDTLVENIISYDSALIPFKIKGAKPLVSELVDMEPTVEVARLANTTGDLVENLTKTKTKVNELDVVARALNLDIVSVVEEKAVETIDFETVSETDNSLYVGESKVKQEGIEGEKEIISNVTYINGEQESSEVSEEVVITEPTNKIVLKGSKQRVYATPAASGNAASIAVSEAWIQVNNGVPYVFGGSSPSGFDCSGLTSYVYGRAGIYLPHSAKAQAGYGSPVSKADLQPGDLVFFTGQGGGSIGHSGIYIGNGQMIHAPVPGSRVSVASINAYYYTSHYVTARRIG